MLEIMRYPVPAVYPSCRKRISHFLALADTFGEQIFNLPVYGAEIILRPGCNLVIKLGRKPERDLFLRPGISGFSH